MFDFFPLFLFLRRKGKNGDIMAQTWLLKLKDELSITPTTTIPDPMTTIIYQHIIDAAHTMHPCATMNDVVRGVMLGVDERGRTMRQITSEIVRNTLFGGGHDDDDDDDDDAFLSMEEPFLTLDGTWEEVGNRDIVLSTNVQPQKPFIQSHESNGNTHIHVYTICVEHPHNHKIYGYTYEELTYMQCAQRMQETWTPYHPQTTSSTQSTSDANVLSFTPDQVEVVRNLLSRQTSKSIHDISKYMLSVFKDTIQGIEEEIQDVDRALLLMN